jgi:hypothetical protein
MGILSEGASRVWRYQRVLWWLFAINLVLAVCGTVPAYLSIAQVADHSLDSLRLVDTFDLPAFYELAANPEVNLRSRTSSPVLFSLIFFALVLFLTGGILEAYRAQHKLSTREFFEGCGRYFWRFVRLLGWMLVAMVPIAIIAVASARWGGRLSDDAPDPKLGFWVMAGGGVLVFLLLSVVRLWADMAQVYAVAEREPAMLRALARGARITFGNLASLLWIYLRIALLGWLALALAFVLWTRVPGRDVTLSFLLFELTLLWWTGCRLWQRASETAWYERNASRLAPIALAPVLALEAPAFVEPGERLQRTPPASAVIEAGEQTEAEPTTEPGMMHPSPGVQPAPGDLSEPVQD